MIYTFILLQFSAHLLADYVFQPQSWSEKKSRKSISLHHLYHAAVVFVLANIFALDYHFWWAALILTALHFFTDVLKSWLQLSARRRGKLRHYFFTDQMIHLLVLVGISLLYDYYSGIHFLFKISTVNAAVFAAFVLSAKPANIIIKNLFDVFAIVYPVESESTASENPTGDEEKSLPNAGKVIGVAERFITLALVLAGQYSAVGLIIAAKSILRFKGPQKNEYILVGTLLSFGIAVLSGIAIRVLLMGK